MLNDFVSEQRQEIVQRCKAKALLRSSEVKRADNPDDLVHSLLDQISASLAAHEVSAGGIDEQLHTSAGETERAMPECSGGLTRFSFTVARVVQEYGDICQSITELAHEHDVVIPAREFGVFSLRLTQAIAEAAEASCAAREQVFRERAEVLHDRLEQFTVEHEHLTRVAADALAAVEMLAVVDGEPARHLGRSLEELGWLVRHVLPELRLASARTILI